MTYGIPNTSLKKYITRTNNKNKQKQDKQR